MLIDAATPSHGLRLTAVCRRVPRGFDLLRDYVSTEAQQTITRWIDQNVPWSFGRFGVRFETYSNDKKPMPAWASALGRGMADEGIFAEPPDYLSLAHYEPGAGIPPHVDREDAFQEVVTGLTLGSTRVFELTGPSRRQVEVLLRPGDLYVLSGPARHRWRHGVPARVSDPFQGQTYPRADCVSATWRVLRNSPCDLQWNDAESA